MMLGDVWHLDELEVDLRFNEDTKPPKSPPEARYWFSQIFMQRMQSEKMQSNLSIPLPELRCHALCGAMLSNMEATRIRGWR